MIVLKQGEMATKFPNDNLFFSHYFVIHCFTIELQGGGVRSPPSLWGAMISP